eukprot:1253646-Rhodomonas_salina.1
MESGFCCKFGKLYRFLLQPIPFNVQQELINRLDDKSKYEDRLFPILVRPLNNYFSFQHYTPLEPLVQTNPLASTCRLWDWRGFENFDITIRGHEVGSQPREIAVLLHRPNCDLQTREFYVHFASVINP